MFFSFCFVFPFCESFGGWSFHEDPEKHVVLLDVRPEAQSQFYSDLASTVAASPNKEAFVFIHGYKTTFEDAARRTGQLAYDFTLVQIRIWNCEEEKAEHLIA